MTAGYGVALESVGNGTLIDQFGNAMYGRTVYVYDRGTTNQVQVYQDNLLTIPITQPIGTGPTGALPGYVQGPRALDILDAASGGTVQAEAISASNVIAAPGVPFVWDAGTTYPLGVLVGYSNASYISLITNNTGHQPNTSPSQWGLVVQEAPGVVSAAPTVNTGQVLFGLGDNVDTIVLEAPTAGQNIDIRVGTAGAPDTSLNPVLKVSRTVSYDSGVGNGTWLGVADANSCPIAGHGVGVSANKVQIVGVLGSVKNFGNNTGLNAAGKFSSPDAVGIQGNAYINNAGGGRTDACTTSLANATVLDPSITAPDAGKSVTGTNVPLGTTIETVTPGVSFVMTNPASANGSPSLVIGGQAVGAAIGSVFGAHLTSATGKAVNGMQMFVFNDSGLDSAVVPTGQSLARGISLYSYGANLGGVGLEVTGPVGTNGSQYDVGVHFPGHTAGPYTGGIKSAGIQDDSTALYGYLINGTHASAAIAVSSGAGPVVIGETAVSNDTALLEVKGGASDANPLLFVGSGSRNQIYSYQLRNSSGLHEWAVAKATNNLITGSVAGDSIFTARTASTAIHIGGSVSTVKVTADNKLGFFNAGAVTQQVSGAGTNFTAGAGTAMSSASTSTGGSGASAYTFSDLVLALKNLGLVAS